MRSNKNNQAWNSTILLASALIILPALGGCGAEDTAGSTRNSGGSSGDSSDSSGGSNDSSSSRAGQGGSSQKSSANSSSSSGGSSKSSSASSSEGGSSGGASSGGSSGGASSPSGGSSGGGSKTGGKTSSSADKSGGTTSSPKGGASGGTSATGSGGTSSSGGSTANTGTTSNLAKFSFFVVSYAAIQKIAGDAKGLGGDLRHGETGAGAGLRGADKICSEVAESSMQGAGAKTWRAFLSATAGEDGKQVNAIERIGKGPWYDRLGRLFANNLDELYYDRPKNADTAIKMDFPNETGVINQNPDRTGNVDNHDMLTGTNDKGMLYSETGTCKDWTSTEKTGSQPRVGHSWPTMSNVCTTTDTRTTGTGGSGGGGGGGGGWPGGGGFPGGGMGGIGNLCNWMSALDESGCAPGVNLLYETGGPGNDGTVGSGGGYGGFYCFALTP